MAVNKVVMNTANGEHTLIDLTNDTVTPEMLAEGVTAHDASGEPIVGTMQSGGGSELPIAQPKYVNFYDYDGTLRYSYTLEEAKALTELPSGIEHAGLVFQEWNWSIQDIKNSTDPIDVGANYSTHDGKTRIYIELTEGRLSPRFGCAPNGTVVVDWGDGSATETLTGTSTSTVKYTEPHRYNSEGKYTIELTVSGTVGFIGNSSEGSLLLTASSAGASQSNGYRNSISKIELGDRVTALGTYALANCRSLRTISTPVNLSMSGSRIFNNANSLVFVAVPANAGFGEYAFAHTYSLRKASLPKNIAGVGSYGFYNCYSLGEIPIPDGASYIRTSAFQNCYSISKVIVPDSVTRIYASAFSGCGSMAVLRFTAETPPTVDATSAFTGLPEDVIVEVPQGSLSVYQNGTNYGTIADRMVGY